MCPLVFDGTLNKEFFAHYIKVCLAPKLSADDVLLLDNSSVHTSTLVLDTLKECGINYLLNFRSWKIGLKSSKNGISWNKFTWFYLQFYLHKRTLAHPKNLDFTLFKNCNFAKVLSIILLMNLEFTGFCYGFRCAKVELLVHTKILSWFKPYWVDVGLG